MNREDIKKIADELSKGAIGLNTVEELREYSRKKYLEIQEKYTLSENFSIMAYLVEDLEKQMEKRRKECEQNKIRVDVKEDENCVFILPPKLENPKDWLVVLEEYRKDFLVGFKEVGITKNSIRLIYFGYKDIILCFNDENINSIKKVYDYFGTTLNK